MMNRRNNDTTRAAWAAAAVACVCAPAQLAVQHTPSVFGADFKRIPTAEESAP